MYDVAEPPALRSGDVLLGTGVVAISDEACRIAREAAAAGVAAFVVRTRETDLPQLRRAASESGITLLVLPAAMRWEQISVLMRQAVAVPASSGAGAATGDLFGFADVLAAAVGGAVTIEDADNQLLAYSTLHEEDLDTPRREAILGRRVPEGWVRYLRGTGILATLETSDDVVTLQANEQLGLRRRLVVAVRAQGELLGSI